MPYVILSKPLSFFYQGLPPSLCHNVWILAIGNNEPLTASQVLSDIAALQVYKKHTSVTFVISKRINSCPSTEIERHWEAFEAMAPIIHDTHIQKDDEPSIHPSSTTTCNLVKSKISNI